MRRIIILAVDHGEPNVTVRAAFWFEAPERYRARGEPAQTQVPDATPEESQAIASGSVIERIHQSAMGTHEARVVLAKHYERTRTDIAKQEASGDLIGTFWDGETWTDGGESARVSARS